MEEKGLSEEEADAVRRLIRHARDLGRAGDEDGALQAMSRVSDLLRLT